MTFKITKFVHSCLIVETQDRVVLFDPGVMSTPMLKIDSIDHLDDVFVTHTHPDHIDIDFINKLVERFPEVKITTTPEVVEQLKQTGIKASAEPPSGVTFFDSPHEDVMPLFPQPQQIGIHYLDSLSDPGDSHSFQETKSILALPITAPWGSTIKAINLTLNLKPKHVIPIHDWHWNDQAREQTYGRFKQILGEHDINFYPMKTGEPVEIKL